MIINLLPISPLISLKFIFRQKIESHELISPNLDTEVLIQTNVTAPNVARRCAQHRAQIFEEITGRHSSQSDADDDGTTFNHIWHADGVRVYGPQNDGSSALLPIAYPTQQL